MVGEADVPVAENVPEVVRADVGWTFRLLSALMTALALVALARHAFVTWSLSAPLALVMEAYNATTQLLLGWTQPYLQSALTWLGSLIGWRPTLFPHWRDVFVLVSLWTAGICRGLRQEGRTWRATATFGWAGALVSALAAGTASLQNSDHLSAVFVVGVPLVVVCFLLFGERMVAGSWRRVSVDLSLIAVLVGLGVLSAQTLLSVTPALVVLATLIATLASGIVLATPQRRRSRFRRPAGLSILTGFAGAALFFAIDGGLKLLMP